MEIENLLKLMELLKEEKKENLNECGSVFQIGEKYIIRTVTFIIVGKLKMVTDKELLFESAAWIADTGRFYDFLKDGSFEEAEPFVDDAIVGRGAIVDGTLWNHDLVRAQK